MFMKYADLRTIDIGLRSYYSIKVFLYFREGSVMSKKSGRSSSAKEKDDVHKPDAAPEPEKTEEMTPGSQPADGAPAPEPEKKASSENEPSKSDAQDKDASEKDASEKDASEKDSAEAKQEKSETAVPEETPAKKAPSKKDPSKKNPPKKAPPKKGSPKKAPPKMPPPKTTLQLLIGLLIKIAVAAAVIWATLTFVLGVSVHYGNNMYPSVHDGDLTVSFRLQKPYLNAVVLYRVNGKTDVGRVIALEGSVVDISDTGLLTINGVAPSNEKIFYATYQAENSSIVFPYKVEPGKVFILNDYRDDPKDSRTFGAIDRKDVKGPMLFTVRRRNF